MLDLAGAVYAGAFLPPLVGALWWKGASRGGAVAALVAGTLAPAAWRYDVLRLVPDLAPVHEVYVGLVVGSGVFVIGGLGGRVQPA